MIVNELKIILKKVLLTRYEFYTRLPHLFKWVFRLQINMYIYIYIFC